MEVGIVESCSTMAWETRGGRRYYYRKRRQADGTITSEYMGHGASGELFSIKMAPRAMSAQWLGWHSKTFERQPGTMAVGGAGRGRCVRSERQRQQAG